jgi:hypothetical protein
MEMRQIIVQVITFGPAQKRMFALIWRLQGREQVYIEITPTPT